MALWRCLGCTTAYAVGAPRCPHCGSTEYEEDGVVPKITRHGGPTIADSAAAAFPGPAAAADPPAPDHAAAEDEVSELHEHAAEDDLPHGATVQDAEPPGPAQGSEPEPDRYEGMTLAELRTEAEVRGLSKAGSKTALADRLREHDSGA